MIYGFILKDGTYEFTEHYINYEPPDHLTLYSATPHLDILGVCRRTFNEAALLPFELNTFRFDSLSALNMGRRSFTYAQRRAIRTIHLQANLDIGSDWNIGLFLFNEKNMLHALLPNLESIIVDFAYPGGAWTGSGRHARIEDGRKAIKDWMLLGYKEGLRIVYNDVVTVW